MNGIGLEYVSVQYNYKGWAIHTEDAHRDDVDVASIGARLGRVDG